MLDREEGCSARSRSYDSVACTVFIELSLGIAVFALNRPDVKNAMSRKLMNQVSFFASFVLYVTDMHSS